MRTKKTNEKEYPKYPDEIYDYYRINRVVNLDKSISKDIEQTLNIELMKLNGKISDQYQISLAIVTTHKPEKWFYDLRSAWMGGKKNDAIIVIGLSDDKIVWSNVMAWTTDKVFEVKLRDSLMQQDKFDVNNIIDNINKNVEFYKRNL